MIGSSAAAASETSEADDPNGTPSISGSGVSGSASQKSIENRRVSQTVPSHGFSEPSLAFKPRLPWIGGDLQTVRNTLLKPFSSARVKLGDYAHRHILFPLSDGTGDRLVGCLTVPDEDAAPIVPQRPRLLGSGPDVKPAMPDAASIDWRRLQPAMGTRPLVVLCHGLSGCETSHYIRSTALFLLQSGFAVLRLNLRGAGPSRPYSTSVYHAGRTRDLADVISAINPPDNGIALCGFSLGGNMVLKLMGELGDDRRIAAAFSVSAPIDLMETQRRLMAPRNRVYHYWLLRRMMKDILSVEGGLRPEHRRRASDIRTVVQFDNELIAPEAGYPSVEAYYDDSSAVKYLPLIRRPTVLIHAANDPWIPVAPYLRFPWRDNGMLLPLILDSGGHVGFHDRHGPPSWHDRQIVKFLLNISAV